MHPQELNRRAHQCDGHINMNSQMEQLMYESRNISRCAAHAPRQILAPHANAHHELPQLLLMSVSQSYRLRLQDVDGFGRYYTQMSVMDIPASWCAGAIGAVAATNLQLCSPF